VDAELGKLAARCRKLLVCKLRECSDLLGRRIVDEYFELERPRIIGCRRRLSRKQGRQDERACQERPRGGDPISWKRCHRTAQTPRMRQTSACCLPTHRQTQRCKSAPRHMTLPMHRLIKPRPGSVFTGECLRCC